jgi:hypothetical protein
MAAGKNYAEYRDELSKLVEQFVDDDDSNTSK